MTRIFGNLEASATHYYKEVAPTLQSSYIDLCTNHPRSNVLWAQRERRNIVISAEKFALMTSFTFHLLIIQVFTPFRLKTEP
jgi:hypothetical protein